MESFKPVKEEIWGLQKVNRGRQIMQEVVSPIQPSVAAGL